MLINALCEYYDILSKRGCVLPDGYSEIDVSYLISLTPDGNIDGIIDYTVKETIEVKGKLKETSKPRVCTVPLKTEKTAIESNYIEFRPVYIFGLDMVKNELQITDKAIKSHKAFVEKNSEFINGIDSPIVNAYRNFLQQWKPENETENELLLSLGKQFNSKFAFCLSGNPNIMLHSDRSIIEKWEKIYFEQLNSNTDAKIAQCAVTGENAEIARIHNKISGFNATGSSLIGFNNAAECSYSNEQSYNSNISVTVMKKYTEALNHLISSRQNKTYIDDNTVLFWAMSEDNSNEDLLASLLFGTNDKADAQAVEQMLKTLMDGVKNGTLSYENIRLTTGIDPKVDFYMVGLKPNVARLAVKFIYRKKSGELLLNVAKHQNDLQISDSNEPIALWQIKREMISPKSKNETIDPAVFAKITQSIIYGYNYPQLLLSTIIRRVKTDADMSVNRVRAGIIKACINRAARLSNKKEELTLSLDTENKNTAYLCGRLFAVLEKLQQNASNNALNRTIKDAYFASAAAKPAIVFPKLLKLSQNHLNKLSNPVYFNKLIGEIIENIDSSFPENLSLTEQGKFIIGYYHQYQSFFVKKENLELMEDE